MKRLASFLLLLLVLASPVAAALFRVWVYHDAVEVGYGLSEEGRKRRQLRRLRQQLEVELAAERSPEQLARRAQALGLVPPTPAQVFGRNVVGGRHDAR